MTKLKRWLVDKYLPAWCREELLAENDRLTKRLLASEHEIDQLNAYIDGMEAALRRRQRITINCKEVSRP